MSIVSTIDPTADLVRRIRADPSISKCLVFRSRRARPSASLLDAITCDEVLAGLLQSGFLSRTVDGTFRLTQAGDQVAPAR